MYKGLGLYRRDWGLVVSKGLGTGCIEGIGAMIVVKGLGTGCIEGIGAVIVVKGLGTSEKTVNSPI
jgi:hypothetical protein